MTGIGATDQVLLLLREQLQRSDRAKGRAATRKDGRPATPQQRIEALAAVADLPERDFRRALVRSLLSERLGAELVADPAFETVTGEVLKMIEDSDETRALLDRVTQDFRAG
ncbi:hypothetical protein [Sphingomonas sp.]|jgi:hypothetical protein|uniref:hypothetical protein n=1 Tax=Sphingomonas sp. TaxID=28214 RepID=UPI002E34180F|nr:hypothetical protein [Sphingomonas sp.]HEX4695785.1 hypothetical protein [Sphingomonas sp.]